MASGSDAESTAATSEEENVESQREGERETAQQDGERETAQQDGEREEPQQDGEREEPQQDGERETAQQDGEREEPQQDEQRAVAQQQDQDGGSEDGGKDADSDSDSDSSGRKASVASAIEDVSSLPGETINDQDGRKIGQVKEVYGVGDDETPMWVTVESSTGLGRSRDLFVPLARIKQQGDEIRVPYSFDHLHDAPEVESGDELSEEDDRALRAYYAVGLADQELVEPAQSYASQVPEDDDPARKIDASSAEGPVREIDDTPPAKQAAEAYEKEQEEKGEEEHRSGRKATADELFDEDGSSSDGEGKGDSDETKASSESEDTSSESSDKSSESSDSSAESSDKSEGEEKSEKDE